MTYKECHEADSFPYAYTFARRIRYLLYTWLTVRTASVIRQQERARTKKNDNRRTDLRQERILHTILLASWLLEFCKRRRP
jgi:hypothetical protein